MKKDTNGTPQNVRVAPATFLGELDRQCDRIIWFATIASLFIWLPYIPTDRELHPDVPAIVYLRLGLTLVACLSTLCLLLIRSEFRSLILLTIIGTYLEAATGAIAGLSGADSVYIGGYLFVLMIVPIGPLPRTVGWFAIASSLVAFAVCAHLSGASFHTTRDIYSIKDICADAIVSAGFVFFVDRLRRRSWQNLVAANDRQRAAERARAEVEEAKRKAQVLADLARRANEGRSMEQLLSALNESFRAELGAERLMLHSVGRDKRTLVLKAIVIGDVVHSPASLAVSTREIPLSEGTGVAYRTFRKMRSLFFPRVKDNYLAQNPEAKVLVAGLEPGWLLVLPLIVRGEVEAILSLMGSKTGTMDREQKAFAERMAAQVAGTVRTLRISDEKEKMAAVGDMAAGIVHDLKNPVAIIKGSVEMAEDPGTTQAERTELHRIIDREADRMLSLVQDLLDFSRGALSISRQPVDAVTYMTRLATVLSPLFESRRIRLTIESKYEGNVQLDPGRFLRILVNIASNAADAIGRDGEFSIQTVRTPEGRIRFTLSDNGPGIPEEIRQSLFEPFVTHGKSHGTGLGMAIAKSLVEAHDGRIWFETETGKGTKFIIEVPA